MPYDPLTPDDLCDALASGNQAARVWAFQHAATRRHPRCIDAALDAWVAHPDDDLDLLDIDRRDWTPDRIARTLLAVSADAPDPLLRAVLYLAAEHGCPAAHALAQQVVRQLSPSMDDDVDDDPDLVAEACVGHATQILLSGDDPEAHATLRQAVHPTRLAQDALDAGATAFLDVIADVLSGPDAPLGLCEVAGALEAPTELHAWHDELQFAFPPEDAELGIAAWNTGPQAFLDWLRPHVDTTEIPDTIVSHWTRMFEWHDRARGRDLAIQACALTGTMPSDPEAASLLAWIVGRDHHHVAAMRSAAGVLAEVEARPDAEATETLNVLLHDLLEAEEALAHPASDHDDRTLQAVLSDTYTAILEVTAQTHPGRLVPLVKTFVDLLEDRHPILEDLAADVVVSAGAHALPLLGNPRRAFHPVLLGRVLRRIGTPEAFQAMLSAAPKKPAFWWHEEIVLMTRPDDAPALVGAIDRWPAQERDVVFEAFDAIHGTQLSDETTRRALRHAAGQRLAKDRRAAKRARRLRRKG